MCTIEWCRFRKCITLLLNHSDKHNCNNVITFRNSKLIFAASALGVPRRTSRSSCAASSFWSDYCFEDSVLKNSRTLTPRFRSRHFRRHLQVAKDSGAGAAHLLCFFQGFCFQRGRGTRREWRSAPRSKAVERRNYGISQPQELMSASTPDYLGSRMLVWMLERHRRCWQCWGCCRCSAFARRSRRARGSTAPCRWRPPRPKKPPRSHATRGPPGGCCCYFYYRCAVARTRPGRIISTAADKLSAPSRPTPRAAIFLNVLKTLKELKWPHFQTPYIRKNKYVF